MDVVSFPLLVCYTCFLLQLIKDKNGGWVEYGVDEQLNNFSIMMPNVYNKARPILYNPARTNSHISTIQTFNLY